MNGTGKGTRGAVRRQSDRVEAGIEQQIEVLEDKASREHWIVADVYSDNNTSASKTRGRALIGRACSKTSMQGRLILSWPSLRHDSYAVE